MIVTGVLIGQRQGGRIENAGFASEEPEQTRRFLDTQARLGSFAQRSVEQQDARRRIERAKTQGWPLDGISKVERWQGIGISNSAERHHRAFAR